MKITYEKMHGAGNGFVLLDNRDGRFSEEECCRLAVTLCGREHTDGMIVVLCDYAEEYGMLFINSDGSVGEMCGNGARCIARYGVEHGLSKDPEHIRFRSTAGVITGKRIDRERYQVKLNNPSVMDFHRSVTVDGIAWDCFYTELGNPGIPHAVVFPDEALQENRNSLRDANSIREKGTFRDESIAPSEDALRTKDTSPDTKGFPDLDDLRETGRSLRYAKEFPRGANVTFVRITGEASVKAVTFERGVEDFTLACGTGSGATALCCILSGRTKGDTLTVSMPGGELSVTLVRTGNQVEELLLTGPTADLGERTMGI